MSGLLSSVYGVVVGIRNRLFDRGILRTYRSRIPVLCIGNLTVGGTGKTPLTLLTAQMLIEAGRRPVLLSRGYGGTNRAPHVVSPADDWRVVGDEPLLMARRAIAPVVIARSRAAGAQYIEARNLGDVIVLDDGFQHRWLERVLNVVCIAAGSEEAVDRFVDGELLPGGIFREPPDVGFKRASAVVLSARSTTPVTDRNRERLRTVIPEELPCFETHIERIVCSDSNGVAVAPPVEALLLCGIANSEGFERTARNMGIRALETYRYADHTFASAESLQVLREQFPNVPLVCTEKDQVKLDPPAAAGVLMLQADIVIAPRERFLELLMHACA